MNIENLEKLASYLESGKLKAKFDMGLFSNKSFLPEAETSCGSVGCAIGHGPYAGIPKQYGENWYDYALRVFDLRCTNFQWCFDAGWIEVDNTPEGAARRIRYLIEHQGMEPDTWRGQMRGEEPLSY